MAGPARPIIHGRDHLAGGPDPIPGIGGGGGDRVFGAGWAGPYPLTVLTGITWKVPKVEGADMTFNLDRILFRLETPGTASTTVHVVKSSGGGAFSGTTVGTTLTLTAGSYETSITSSLGTVASGDLLRIVWDAVGGGAQNYLVAVEGTQA